MKAVLHTACGCSKEMQIPKWEPVIKVAMTGRRHLAELYDPASIRYMVRTFEFAHETSGPYGALHYEEVL